MNTLGIAVEGEVAEEGADQTLVSGDNNLILTNAAIAALKFDLGGAGLIPSQGFVDAMRNDIYGPNYANNYIASVIGTGTNNQTLV